MKLALPESVKYIIDTLSTHGFEAYAVGGCVRDTILGRVPDDWDITTSALPQQIKAVFSRTVDTGIEHGTVTVLHKGKGYEVTTYRIDGEYEDGRHPKEVAFTPNLKEDLRRRDFTINAMAYNEEKGLVDIFHGTEDLENKRICCVGDAMERFGEDALRILRGVRFAAQLGFSLEESTKNAMKRLAPTLSKISAERIQVELSKLLLSRNPGQIDDLIKYGIARVIFPEYAQLEPQKRQRIVRQLAVLNARRERDESVSGSGKTQQLALRWAVVLQFFEEKQVAGILHSLKYDNKTIRFVQGILKFRGESSGDCVFVRKALCAMGAELFLMEMEYRLSQTEKEEEMQKVLHMLDTRQVVIEKGECTSLRELALTGSDLLEIGVPKGKEIGRILHELLLVVLEHPEMNEKERLLMEAKERIGAGL